MTDDVIRYCEEHGIYEIYKQKGDVLIYYSYFGSFYRIEHNMKTGKEVRTRLRYKKAPKFLVGEYGTKYNYYCG